VFFIFIRYSFLSYARTQGVKQGVGGCSLLHDDPIHPHPLLELLNLEAGRQRLLQLLGLLLVRDDEGVEEAGATNLKWRDNREG
jgi:hypothetical protein